MKDITIKDAPDNCEINIKEMAAVAVERFFRESLKVPEEDIIAFEKNVNDFRIANNLDPRFK